MKKFLRFSGIIAAVIAVVALILMLATNCIITKGAIGSLGNGVAKYSGTVGIFGVGKESYVIESVIGNTSGTIDISGDNAAKAVATAVIAFILLIVGILALAAGIVLPIFAGKKAILGKIAGICSLVAIPVLIVAGVLIFFELPSFASANSINNTDGYSIGAGWVISGILAIVAGGCAAAPTVANLVAKK